ncbi:MAG: rhodanese-like domain-containing protein [Acidiferrobacteraceae bacterium]
MFHFVAQNWYLFVALAVIVALLVFPAARQLMLGVENVSPGQAIQIANHRSGFFIDVRRADEFAAGHIPKAKNIPLEKLAASSTELEKLKGKPLILYCQSGQRSMRAATLLRKQGIDSVYNLAGGFVHWQRENLPAER